jgi:excisionase family DNA binding protein
MPQEPDAPLAYTINGAAKALSCSRSHIYRSAMRGELDLRKVGQKSVITASSIKRLIGEAA